MEENSTAVAHGDHELPAWLKPERFEDPNFNPEALVADLRRHVPLNIAKSELQAYLVALKEQLIEVINQDFGDYVGLASRLNSIDGSVVRMKQPLLDIQAKLYAVETGLKAELLALQQGLELRQEIAGARGTLELMQEVAHVASKVEKLLAEVQAASSSGSEPGGAGGTGAGGGARALDGPRVAAAAAAAGLASMDGAAASGDPDAHARMLERVAAEVSRLSFLANKGKDLAFIAAAERRIQTARLQLGAHLSAALTSALQQQRWQAAAHCLHAYVELGDVAAGEATLRGALAAPLAAEAVKEAKRRLAADPGTKAREVALVSSAALDGLQRRAGPLVSTLLAPASGLGAFDLLGSILLHEITKAMADGMPGAFSPGNPASFHANFVAGQALLSSLESLAQTRAAAEKLRGSDAYSSFSKRWNLPVYFSLQYQDIAGAFEDAARSDKLEPAAAGGPGSLPLLLAVSAALWGGLQQCAAEGVFLAPLGDRFLRLACQLSARYASWVRDAAAARREALANPQAAAAPPPGALSPGAAAAGAPAAPPPPPQASGPEAWAGQVAAEELLAICPDAATLGQLLTGQLLGQLLLLMPGAPDEVAGGVRAALQRAADRIGEESEQVLSVVSEEVAERCVAIVRQLKGITATYRMTSKGAPTRHSHYVSGVLVPLRNILDAPGAPQHLPQPARLQLAALTFDLVNLRYQQLAEELLSSVRKTESSLKRLKKGRGPDSGGGGEAGGAAEMSDSDKICLQLYLDVQEHGRQAARVGIQAEGRGSFAALLAVVTPPQQQQQQQQGATAAAEPGGGAGAAAQGLQQAAEQQRQPPGGGFPPYGQQEALFQQHQQQQQQQQQQQRPLLPQQFQTSPYLQAPGLQQQQQP